MDPSFWAAAASLTAAPLARLVDSINDLVAATAPGARATLLVADYRHDTLVPAVGDGEDVPVDDGPAGRSYVDQRPQQERRAGSTVVWLPVTTHGDRLGVLAIELPGSAPTTALDLTVGEALAAITARALRAAVPVSDGYLIARRVRALTVAAEMQWALLPGNSFADEHVVVAGQLEPAYAASGDAYDWCRSPGDLFVAVFDAPGRGVDAATYTALAVNAFRNARRGEVDLAQMVSLTDQALYGYAGGSRQLPAVFLRIDLTDGGGQAIYAGSPVVLRRRGGDVAHIELDPQLPLGMFQDSVYTAEPIDVRPGDRLLVVTDGAHGTQADGNPALTFDALTSLMHVTADQPPWELTRELIRQAMQTIGRDLDQDIAAVALDLR